MESEIPLMSLEERDGNKRPTKPARPRTRMRTRIRSGNPQTGSSEHGASLSPAARSQARPFF